MLAGSEQKQHWSLTFPWTIVALARRVYLLCPWAPLAHTMQPACRAPWYVHSLARRRSSSCASSGRASLKKKIDRTEQGETARLAEKPEVEAGVCAVRRVSSQARSLGNEERAGNCTQSFGAHFTYVDVVVLKIP